MEAPVETYNVHHAKTHLSKLIDKAAKGEPFIIARAGKPLVKVVPIDEPEKKPVRRIGFMKGMFEIPDNFKEIGREEIEEMFYGKPD